MAAARKGPSAFPAEAPKALDDGTPETDCPDINNGNDDMDYDPDDDPYTDVKTAMTFDDDWGLLVTDENELLIP